MSKPDDTNERTANSHSRKESVHERDRQQCINCLGSRDLVSKLDLDHVVPRGVGGSDQFSNAASLCRRCHKAKHGEGLAPTVQFESTGRMTDVEFVWFKQFVKEILPALAREFGIRLRPKFNLDGEDAWRVPIGDFRRLDRRLTERDDRYRTVQASEFM